MRAEGVLKVILNVQIVAGMPAKLRDDKYIEIIACEKPPAFTKFLFKLGNKENAKAFFDSILLVMPKEEETKGAEVKADASKAEASTGEETVDSVETASEPGFSQTQNLDSGEEDRPEDEPEVKESPKKE